MRVNPVRRFMHCAVLVTYARERKDEKLKFCFKAKVTFHIITSLWLLFGLLTLFFQPYKQGKRLEMYDLLMHRTRFHWIIKRKPKIQLLGLGHVIPNLALVVGQSFLCRREGVGLVFFINHISKCSCPPSILFDQSLITEKIKSQLRN